MQSGVVVHRITVGRALFGLLFLGAGSSAFGQAEAEPVYALSLHEYRGQAVLESAARKQQPAIFVGKNEVLYCLERGDSFPLTLEASKEQFEIAVQKWRDYLSPHQFFQELSKHDLEPNLRFKFQERCDSSTHLTLALAVTNEAIRAEKVHYEKPVSLYIPLSYDETSGNGRAIIWVEDPGKDLPGMAEAWVKFPHHLQGLLMHELGHAMGCNDHVPGTIMDRDITWAVAPATTHPDDTFTPYRLSTTLQNFDLSNQLLSRDSVGYLALRPGEVARQIPVTHQVWWTEDFELDQQKGPVHQLSRTEVKTGDFARLRARCTDLEARDENACFVYEEGDATSVKEFPLNIIHGSYKVYRPGYKGFLIKRNRSTFYHTLGESSSFQARTRDSQGGSHWLRVTLGMGGPSVTVDELTESPMKDYIGYGDERLFRSHILFHYPVRK